MSIYNIVRGVLKLSRPHQKEPFVDFVELMRCYTSNARELAFISVRKR